MTNLEIDLFILRSDEMAILGNKKTVQAASKTDSVEPMSTENTMVAEVLASVENSNTKAVKTFTDAYEGVLKTNNQKLLSSFISEMKDLYNSDEGMRKLFNTSEILLSLVVSADVEEPEFLEDNKVLDVQQLERLFFTSVATDDVESFRNKLKNEFPKYKTMVSESPTLTNFYDGIPMSVMTHGNMYSVN